MRGFTAPERFGVPETMTEADWQKLEKSNRDRVLNRPRLPMAEDMIQPWAAYNPINNGRRKQSGGGT